jgi:hypothetical protein
MTKLTMYDVGLDEMRDVTQADVDGLFRSVRIFAGYREAIEALDVLNRDMHHGRVRPFNVAQAIRDAAAAHRVAKKAAA